MDPSESSKAATCWLERKEPNLEYEEELYPALFHAADRCHRYKA